MTELPPRTTDRLYRIVLPSLPLECGVTLSHPRVAFHLEGTISPQRDNVVLAIHPLTGSSDVAKWWRGVVGPGLALDTRRVAVLAPNLIGSCYGSTGPSEGTQGFPPVTTRDQARAIGVLLEHLRIPRVALVTGGSLGGMVALEFVATFPRRACSAVVFAAPAKANAAALGWVHVQREVLRAAGEEGLALARQVAMLTYRTPSGLQRRFGGREDGATGRAVREWLRVHGERLSARFTRASYLALLDAMDTHDLARGRDGVGTRLRSSGARLTGVGIPGDLVYPAEEVGAWVAAAGGAYRAIDSDVGHDAFLLETRQVGAILAEALEAVADDDLGTAPFAPAEVA